MKIKLSIISCLLLIFLIGFGSAGTWSYDNSYSEGSCNAYAKVSGMYPECDGTKHGEYCVGKYYIDVSHSGSKFYIAYRPLDWMSCDKNGCSGQSRTSINDGRIYLEENGKIPYYILCAQDYESESGGCNTYTNNCDKCGNIYSGSCAKYGESCGYSTTAPVCCPGLNCEYFGCYGTADPMCKSCTICGDDCWSWASKCGGYIGNKYFNLKNVECYQDSDCPNGFCDKAGVFQDWNCKLKECDTNQEKCVDTDSYSCQDYKWKKDGKILNKCGVECIVDGNCPNDELFGDKSCDGLNVVQLAKDYYCLNYKCNFAETTKVVEFCDVKCEDGVCVACTENEIIQIAEEYQICREGTYQRVLDLVEFSDEEQQALLEQINLLESTVEEKAELINQLNLNIGEQVELINQLELSLNEKILIVQTLTSNLEEQTNLISELELNLQEKIIIVQTLTQNIEDQAVIIQELSSNAEEQSLIINGLNLNIQEQSQIISEMELTVLEQSIIIENLNLNIQEQAIIINNLNANLATKIELISQLEITTQEQQDLIDQMALSFADQQTIINALNVTIQDDAQQITNLQLTISESAEYITSLELTVSQQSELVSQLQLSATEQASLISQLELNNEEKAQLISNLNLRLDEQADLITLMNLELDDDAEIIRNLNLQLNEEAELIIQLNLNIDAQLEIIQQLELKISEEKELVTQLRLTIEEQLLILERLQEYRDTPVYVHFWNNYKGYIIAIGALILLIIWSLFKKKKK